MSVVRLCVWGAMALAPFFAFSAERRFESAPEVADQPNPAAESIRRALDGPVVESVPEMPLNEFVEYLQAAYHFEVQLDGKSVSEKSIDPTDRIAMNVKGVRLQTALELALRSLGLTWTIYDDVLLITSPEEAQELLVVKVYDVNDLIWSRDAYGDEIGSLIELITSSIDPATWDEVGGPASIQEFPSANGRALVIGQTPQAHERISSLLAALRRIGGKSHASEVDRPDAARPRSLAAAKDRREPPGRRRRSRTYQATPGWMTPQLHR